MQCCTCSKWVHLRCSQLSLSKFIIFDSSHSWSSPPAVSPLVTLSLSPRTPPTCIPLLYNLALRLLMLHSLHTIVFKLLIPRLSILYLLPLPPHHRLLLLAVLLRLLSPDFLRVLQWNAGGLKLLHFLSSHPVDLICIQESNLNSFSSFRISGFSTLRSDCPHSRSGILSPDATHASGGIIIFVRQGLYFFELSTSSLSSLDPYSDYAGVNISLNNSSSLSFLNVYAPPIRFSPTDGRTDSFSPSILPFSINLFFWGASIAITPSGTQEVLTTPVGSMYSTGSSLLASSLSITQIHPTFYIAPLLTSPLLPLLLPFLAPGRCFRTWVLATYKLFYLSLSLRSFAPTNVPFLELSESSLG